MHQKSVHFSYAWKPVLHWTGGAVGLACRGQTPSREILMTLRIGGSMLRSSPTGKEPCTDKHEFVKTLIYILGSM